MAYNLGDSASMLLAGAGALLNPAEWWDEEGNFIGPSDAYYDAFNAKQAEIDARANPGDEAKAAGDAKGKTLDGLADEQRAAGWKAAGLFSPFQRAGVGALAGQSQYQDAGLDALRAQQALAGLLGPDAQRAAIAQLESSPQFQALAAQGERAILTNASATGGVRGGNTAGALASYRPQLLSSIIDQQYARLAGMAGMGSNAGQGLVQAGLAGASGQAGAITGGAAAAGTLGADAANARAGGELARIQYELDRQRQNTELILSVLAAGAPVVGAALGGPPGAAVGLGVSSAASGAANGGGTTMRGF